MVNTLSSRPDPRRAGIRSGLVKGLGAVAIAFGAPMRPSWLTLNPTTAGADR